MPTKTMTVQELFDEFIEAKTYEIRKVSVSKIIRFFKNHILTNFSNYRIDKITVRDVQNWKISIERKNLSLSTKKTAFIYFNAMINYAIKMEYLQKNPLEKIGNFKNTLGFKREMNFYTPQEFKEFITSAKETATEKENLNNDLSEWNYYVFFNIAFYTGLRKGEIHALKWSDIEGEYLSVSRSLYQKLKDGDIETPPKNPTSCRTLQMPIPLITILDEHKKLQERLHNFTDDFRICNNVRDTSLQRKKKLYSEQANVKTIRIHDFRHSHASVLANNNINIQEVARRLGHSRIEITLNRYCHLYPKEEEKAVSVLNSLT